MTLTLPKVDPKAAEARAARKAKINAIAELSKEAGTLKVSCKLNLAACLVATFSCPGALVGMLPSGV